MDAVARDDALLRDLAAAARDELAAAGIEGAELDARLLVCAAAGADHAELIAGGDREVDRAAAGLLRRFVSRRVAGTPVSRILGRREFWSLEFEITPATLDPRPDTETVVEAALQAVEFSGQRARDLRICDLGTGSGCLLVTLLAELPGAVGLGVDVSAEALAVARRNAEAHDVSRRADFVETSWTDGLEGRFDLIVSNPPYIRSDDIASLAPEVRDHDPPVSLDGGADGLDAYRRIVADAFARLEGGGWLVLEVGAGQAAAVYQMMADAGYEADGALPGIVRDLAGHERCVRAIAR